MPTTLTGVHAAVSRITDMVIARKTIPMAKGNFVTLTCPPLVLMLNPVLTYQESSYPGKLVMVKVLRCASFSMNHKGENLDMSWKYTILYNPISFLDHIDGSTTSGGSLTTAYERRTSTESTPKISATSTFATTIKDTTEDQSEQGIFLT